MGCDGGSIPRRDEMVKLKKKAEKADKDAALAAKWKHCSLTAEELNRPIISCELGRLYNKEALLLALLDKPALPELAKHIRSLKDVVELKLTINPGYKAAAAGDGYNDAQTSEYVCPVSGLEMSGRYRFAYLRGCGCVFSEKALKEVPSEFCHKCGSPFTAGDVVMLNGSDDDLQKLSEAMLERRALAKQVKASKKKSKAELPTITEMSTSTGVSNIDTRVSTGASCLANATVPITTDTATTTECTSTEGSSTITTTSSAEDRGSPPNEKRIKLYPETTSKTVKKSTVQHRQSKFQAKSSGSKLRTGSSVAALTKKATSDMRSTFKPAAKDKSARKVYKSLFHSESRPKARTSNWVTYNPYF